MICDCGWFGRLKRISKKKKNTVSQCYRDVGLTYIMWFTHVFVNPTNNGYIRNGACALFVWHVPSPTQNPYKDLGLTMPRAPMKLWPQFRHIQHRLIWMAGRSTSNMLEELNNVEFHSQMIDMDEYTSLNLTCILWPHHLIKNIHMNTWETHQSIFLSKHTTSRRLFTSHGEFRLEKASSPKKYISAKNLSTAIVIV